LSAYDSAEHSGVLIRCTDSEGEAISKVAEYSQSKSYEKIRHNHVRNCFLLSRNLNV
jgi:hypothetical protein